MIAAFIGGFVIAAKWPLGRRHASVARGLERQEGGAGVPDAALEWATKAGP
jgi:hypothetical protein